ncbi:MAG: 30S ribosomal protein S6 [Candidatus Paceibacterota bacterium]
MVENTMPTAEVELVADDERAAYELAFHILPTVVEGEVPSVFEALKEIVTNAGGAITDEEAPQRFDLAYEIVKHLEGKDRRFASAYFGWVRFTADPANAEPIARNAEVHPQVLRHLLIRLTRVEEANPFRFHEAYESEKRVENIEEREVEPEAAKTTESDDVDDSELDEALKKEDA